MMRMIAIAVLVALVSAAAFGAEPTEPAAYGRLEVESAEVTFDAAHGDGPKDYPSAVVVRVLSNRPWALRLIPAAPMAEERGATVGWGRMQWRTRGLSFQPMTATGAVVARGQATGASGELVTIDLRLHFADSDPLGRYGCTLQVSLDAL